MEYDPDQVIQIREIAHGRLLRLSSADSLPTESFLFKDDRFCGIRYRTGLFHAQWMAGEDLIEFFREGSLVDQIRLNSSARAA